MGWYVILEQGVLPSLERLLRRVILQLSWQWALVTTQHKQKPQWQEVVDDNAAEQSCGAHRGRQISARANFLSEPEPVTSNGSFPDLETTSHSNEYIFSRQTTKLN